MTNSTVKPKLRLNPRREGRGEGKSPWETSCSRKSMVIFELDLKALFELNIFKEEFKAIQKFPMMERDLAIYVEKRTEVEEVKNLIEEVGGKFLKQLELFDIFENKENNKKSLAFHLIFGKKSGTLQGFEVDKKIEDISQKLEEKNYEMRKA